MTEKKIISQINGTQFHNDLGVDLNVNGHNMGRGMYNLIVSIRDVSLFTKGIKPHRFWRLKDVKFYFGLVGGKDKCLEQLNAYKEFLTK
ncbi:MAG: hypothetical protein ACW98X_26055 [Promethearchaeota archaeon]|jgi:hypothetical protein